MPSASAIGQQMKHVYVDSVNLKSADVKQHVWWREAEVLLPS
jgi:hypothetical protein